MASSSAFDGVQVLVNLIGTINGNVNDWLLVDVSESQVGSDDEFLRLESGWDEHPVLVDLGTLGNDPLDNIWDGRARADSDDGVVW